MNFTDSPFERMMKQRPRYSPQNKPLPKPPKNSLCRGCAYWRGMACVGTCYRDLIITRKEGAGTSGQLGPKSPDKL